MSSIFLAIASFFFFVFTAPTFHASRKSDPIIDNQLRLVWKVNTGVACFRTRPLVHGGELIMGSNGMNYMDYNLFDKKSGIYVMDAATGTIRSHFGNEVLGDMDVNGVLF